MIAAESRAHKKRTGSHFTPMALARFVAQRIVSAAAFGSSSSIRILDPACGDGELLEAIAYTLPKNALSKVILSGIDCDAFSLHIAEERLNQLSLKSLDLQEADFLTLVADQRRQRGLFDEQAYASLIEPAHAIIANPPYVRTQVLGAEKAQEIARTFDLSGRVDLYHAFLVAMTRCLVPDGILGVITSNRFLTTRGGAAIREFLEREYDIIEIVDLGDTKLFEAAVLPAILVARKRPPRHAQKRALNQTAQFTRIYEHAYEPMQAGGSITPVESIYDALETMQDGLYRVSGRHYKIATGTLAIPSSPADPWRTATSNEQEWLQTVHAHAKFRISDVARVRVGIKTCADEVFIRTDWEVLPEWMRPEKEIIHCMLSHDDAGRWTAQTDERQWRRVLYTHETQSGKRKAINLENYPRAAAYLENHRPRLEGREYVIKAKRHWFEIWVPQQPDAFRLPKVIFPDISPEPKFFFDDQGYMVDGNCYWITVESGHDPNLLFLIQAIANSKLMTRYHDVSFNNKLYSGRRRYLTQYVEKYPLPDPALEGAQHIITLAKELVFHAHSDEEQSAKEQQIEAAVAGLFGVDF